ncbi:TPA: hypothetical protein ROU58_001459 [Raoultella ornithinolytica CD1_MRS_4]|nr:hypothetical protein [Raoultella ornithinolytica CD1_MRS_4]
MMLYLPTTITRQIINLRRDNAFDDCRIGVFIPGNTNIGHVGRIACHHDIKCPQAAAHALRQFAAKTTLNSFSYFSRKLLCAAMFTNDFRLNQNI